MVSYHLKLVGNTEGYSINTDVNFSKIKGIELADKIIIKDTKNLLVRNSTLVDGKQASFNRGYLNENGEIVDKGDLHYFVMKNEKEIEVSKFPRTKDMEVRFIPKEVMKQALIHGTYEIFGKNLLGLAEYLKENGKVLVGKFSFGNGFKMYMAIIEPIFLDDKFVLKMSLSNGKLEFKNAMDTKEKPKKTALPTLEEIYAS